MNVLKFILQRKILVLLVSIFIVILGSYAATELGQELMPAIDFDGAIVMIAAGDMQTIDVETMLATPIEKRLLGINGVKGIDTTISAGRATLIIRFESGRMDELFREVETVVNSMKGQMPTVQDIIAYKMSTSQPHEFFMEVSEGDMEVMTSFATNVLKPRLEALGEVREVALEGLFENEILITLDTQKLLQYGLNPAQIIALIQSTNIETSLGVFNDENNRPLLRIDTSFNDVEDIRKLSISTMNGIMPLEDFAEVKVEKKTNHSAIWKDGSNQFIFVQIGRVSDVTQIDMAKAIRAEITKIQEEGLVRDFKVREVVAQADYVEEAINGVSNNLMMGAIFALVILILFLRNIRATVIIALSIPSSILLTFTMMWIFDHSFNMLTLIGLGLGIGMMVDASIVILESIYRKKEEGLVGFDAVIEGVREVATAVIASMLTTIVVFVPVSLMGGELGSFMVILSVIIAVTLISSVLVSFTLIPTLAEKFLRLKKEQTGSNDSKFIRKYGNLVSWMANKKRNRLAVLLIFTVMFASSMFLITKIPMSVMPDFYNRYTEMVINLEPGVSSDEKSDIINEISKEISVVQDVESHYIIDNGVNFYMIVNMTKEDEITRHQDLVNQDIMSSLRSIADEYPISNIMGIMSQSAGGFPVQIHIQGDSFEELNLLALQLSEELSSVDGIVGISNTNERQSEQQLITLHEQAILEDGLSFDQIKQYIGLLSMDVPVGELKANNDTTSIRLITKENLTTKDNLLAMEIPTMQGLEKLSKYIGLETIETPNQISHKDGQRYITVQADIEGRDLGSVNRDVQKMIDNFDVPKGYTVSIAGDLEAQSEAMKDLIMVFAISIFLVYVVMAVQFNHLAHPLVIMSIIPMTIVGVILGLFVTQMELTMLSGMGVIILIGIVLNNAILLVDRTKQLRYTGLEVGASLIEACKNRIRPILMTTLTTSGGMLPLALASGAAGNYQAPLATVIITGLLFATLITLILIPAVYMTFNDIGNGISKLVNRGKSKGVQAEELTSN